MAEHQAQVRMNAKCRECGEMSVQDTPDNIHMWIKQHTESKHPQKGKQLARLDAIFLQRRKDLLAAQQALGAFVVSIMEVERSAVILAPGTSVPPSKAEQPN